MLTIGIVHPFKISEGAVMLHIISEGKIVFDRIPAVIEKIIIRMQQRFPVKEEDK